MKIIKMFIAGILKSPLVFTGISGAGKSILAQELAQEYKLKIIDVFKYVKPYIDKYGSAKVKGNILKRAYGDLILDLPNLDFDILEIASDWPDEFIPKIIEKLKTKPILIFCDAPLEICLQRNLQRNKKKNLPVPKEILQNQARFDHNFYKNLTFKLKVKFIAIDTEGSSSKSYQDLKNTLKNKKLKL